MVAVIDIQAIIHPAGESPRREGFIGDSTQAATWLRALADELDTHDTAVITTSEPPEQAACRLRAEDECAYAKLQPFIASHIAGPLEPRGMDCMVAKRTGFACLDHRWHALAEHIIPFGRTTST